MNLTAAQEQMKVELSLGSIKKEVSAKPRKQFTIDEIPKETLEHFYVDLGLQVQVIAMKFNKTRGRIWQLLKKYNLTRDNYKTKICVRPSCGKSYRVVRSREKNYPPKYCSDKCYHDHRQEVGSHNPSRVGRARGRKVIEDWLGIKLPIGFIVHHEDGDEQNNDPENLFVFPSHSDHLKYHHAKRNGNGELPYKELWELPGKIEEWLLECS